MKNTKKQYIAPTCSLISIDETSSLVALSPPSDGNEGSEWWNCAYEEEEPRITPFTMSEYNGSSSGTPFGSGGPFD